MILICSFFRTVPTLHHFNIVHIKECMRCMHELVPAAWLHSLTDVNQRQVDEEKGLISDAWKTWKFGTIKSNYRILYWRGQYFCWRLSQNKTHNRYSFSSIRTSNPVNKKIRAYGSKPASFFNGNFTVGIAIVIIVLFLVPVRKRGTLIHR